MVSVLELMAKFGPTHEVKPWGECIIIQGTEFDPDWEAELADQGYNCHEGIQDDHPVTYIQLKKSVAPGKVVYVPPKDPVAVAAARVYWSPEEDVFFLELWKSDLTIDQISLSVVEKFPIRVGKAVKSRLDRLKIAGKIQCRKHSGNEVKEMEKKNQVAGRGSGCRQGPDWTQAQTDLLTAKRRLRGSGRCRVPINPALWITTTTDKLLSVLFNELENPLTKNPESKIYRWSIYDNPFLPKAFIDA
jgi:hypothetical protein